MRKAIYLGTDSEYCRDIESFFQLRSGGPVEIKQMEVSSIANGLAIGTVPPHIVIIDLSDEKFDAALMIEVIHGFKSHGEFRKVPIVALFGTAHDFSYYSLLCGIGVNYIHIKGSDLNLFLIDIFYLAFESDVHFPRLATFKDADITLEASFFAAMREVSLGKLVIETDLVLEEGEEVILKSSLGGEVARCQYTIDNRVPGMPYYYFLEGYELEVPLRGPWDEPDDPYKIDRDTVETWIDNHQEILLQKNNHIFVYGRGHDTKLMVNVLMEQCKSRINWFESLVEDCDSIPLLCPEIIMIQLEENSEAPEEANTFENIPLIIKQIQQTPNYNPVLILFNSPSTSEAVQTVMGYEKIVALTGEFTCELLEGIFRRYNSRMSNEFSYEHYHFLNLSAPARALEIKREIILHTMSEHEVTFSYDGDLPMYSVLSLESPRPIMLMIIPSPIPLYNTPKGKTYYALIMGITEDHFKFLRTFVNKAIGNPKAAFQSLDEEEHENEIKDEHERQLEEHIQEEKSEAPILEQTRGNLINGRSKL